MALRCAYCHDQLAGAPRTCPACATQLHAECADALGGTCPTLGCARAPAPTSAKPRRWPVGVAAFLLVCVWCGFGYEIGANLRRLRIDEARLRAACNAVRARTVADGRGDWWYCKPQPTPPELVQFEPESVHMSPDGVRVVLGGTIGGDYGYWLPVQADGRLGGPHWFCTQ